MLRIGKMEPFQPLLWSLSATAKAVPPRIHAQSRRRRLFAGVKTAWFFAGLPLKNTRDTAFDSAASRIPLSCRYRGREKRTVIGGGVRLSLASKSNSTMAMPGLLLAPAETRPSVVASKCPGNGLPKRELAPIPGGSITRAPPR
jgi:hypothetical protein